MTDAQMLQNLNPFMKFRQGKGEYARDIYVNMSQVCHFASDGATGSVMTFSAVIGEEPAYICVTEPPDEIASALELRRRIELDGTK